MAQKLAWSAEKKNSTPGNPIGSRQGWSNVGGAYQGAGAKSSGVL
jgi:hypothetical protein